MERRRIIRLLKIGWTALFAVLCGLLVALWVRSYWYVDRLSLFHALSVSLQSVAGRQLIDVYANPWETYMKAAETRRDPRRIWHWRLSSRPVMNRDFPAPGIRWHVSNDEFEGCVPHWFLLLVGIAGAIWPWTRWSRRFSLRTLLIATTFVAVLLGLIAAAIR